MGPSQGSLPKNLSDSRYERKFHILDLSARQIEAVVHSAGAHFREVYPPRIVNNIYFDTPGLSDYWRHVNGSANRSKLRLRWYGELGKTPTRSVLEIKAKHGQVGTKAACPLKDITPDTLADHHRLCHELRQECSNPAFNERLRVCTPAMFNRYARRYFCSSDGRFRLTVDTDLCFKEVAGRRFGPRSSFKEERLVVVELKYATDAESDIHQVLRNWPLRVSRMSKYVYGIKRLQGIDVELL